ncbi:tumor necrosis factor receptor superfamily member 11A [Ambystoma mexicanum]|uniref:tumor necrosis factor receptor superfamily member 11A n=1 Tax=Ambystoma mexicanum TaxID=8296 RepID=UPI0037E7CFB6
MKMASSFPHVLRGIRPGWLVVCMLLARQQVTHTCDTATQYEHLGGCCSKCEPGKYMSARCTATSATVCLPCDTNQYIDVWNEEEKCWLQKLCDPGKGLAVLSRGNSTLERKCACTPGYHLNRDYEYCIRNTECDPGFGAQRPPTKDTDTVCTPCALGRFSNISSAFEECQPWTNCTALGKAEKAHGTNFSDAVCHEGNSTLDIRKPLEDGEEFFYILILLLSFASVASASIIILICYRKKVKTLTVKLQRWGQEFCIRGDKEKCRNTFNNPHLNPAFVQHSDGVHLLTLDGKSFSEQDMGYSEGHILCGDSGLESSLSELGEDAPLSSATDSEEDQPPNGPTEDEYVDQSHQRAIWYLDTVTHVQRESALPFSEPLEVGEYDHFSQCFVGTESVFSSNDSHGSEHSCGDDCAHAFSVNSVQIACQCMGMHHVVQDKSVASSPAVLDVCHTCNGLVGDFYISRVGHTDIGNNIISEKVENGYYQEHNSDSGCLAAEQSTSANGAGENLLLDSTDTSHPSTNRSTSQASSTSNCSSSVTPAPSGNVTGNSNSTFISSGQVMNFKGDIIVVYVSQNSQEAPTATAETDENVGNPVQEENQSRCDSFVGNTQQSKDKCSNGPVEEEVQGASLVYKTNLGTTVHKEATRGGGLCHRGPLVEPLPVQEEGKPGPFMQ